MQKKGPDIRKEKSRDPKEGLFAHGGVSLIVFCVIFLTLGAILSYLSPAWMAGRFSYGAVKSFYLDEGSLHQMAFTALALMELVHMLGMSDLKHSFVHVFKDGNWMMALAFFLGVGLQLLVIEVPGVSDVFSAANLTWAEWLVTAAATLLPLLLHEGWVRTARRKKRSKRG